MDAIAIIRHNSQPLEPLATLTEPVLPPLDDIRAVLFDVYGTLVISASGDISLVNGNGRGVAVEAAVERAGLRLTNVSSNEVVDRLHAEIQRQHAAAAYEYPEVDIHEVWRGLLQTLVVDGAIDRLPAQHEIATLALEYETLVNPVWPMPGLTECLEALRSAGLSLGIVSNAQAFTRELFPALVGKSLEEFGFDELFCVWSYAERQAKPGEWMYRKVAESLADRGIAPGEVLYVGNDMRNDIAPASAMGFCTVLFAGDARSLRWREGDPLVGDTKPTAVVTDLGQILAILRLAPRPL